MTADRYREESPDLERAMDEARDGAPPSEELQTMLTALRRKREALQAEIEGLSPSEPLRQRLEKELSTTDRQIQALEEETVITRFVENSVRVAYRVSRLRDGDSP